MTAPCTAAGRAQELDLADLYALIPPRSQEIAAALYGRALKRVLAIEAEAEQQGLNKAMEAQAAPPDALREALLAVEWYANGDNTEAFCITCNADRPGPHKPDCIVGAALAAAPTAHIGSDIMRSPIVHPEDYGYQDAPASGLREALVKVLIEHAVDGFENQGLHGWRCKYPDSYGGGPCSCFADLVDSLVIVVSAAYEEEK